jgi:2-polyprenyl-3-methyl-5-hydroxy-6-metoxy-1,4-benzoquinol methylase
MNIKLNSTLIVLIVLSFKTYSQSVTIDSLEREKERIRWNESLVEDTSYHFNKKPNTFLVTAIKNIKPGKALDVAMGQGRNAIYLAKIGWDVTGYDIADEAMEYAKKEAKLQNVQIKTIRQGSEEFDFGNLQWDLISFIYAGCIEEVPGMAERMKKGLKTGGIIVFEFFHREAGIAMERNDFGCPQNAEKDLLLKLGGFKIITYEEKIDVADYGLDKCKLVRMVAQKL